MLKDVSISTAVGTGSGLEHGVSVNRSPYITGKSNAIAIRTVELSHDLDGIVDVFDYPRVRVYGMFQGGPIACVDIANDYRSIAADTLRISLLDAVSCQRKRNESLRATQPEPAIGLPRDRLLAQIEAALLDKQVPKVQEDPQRLPTDITVSVIIPTCGRPDDLRACLRSLCQQDTKRPVEIIVVDNRPGNNVTPNVVREFPQVKLLAEPRSGISYARNTGIAASSGEIIVLTDDDTFPPPNWLENLIAPYMLPEVMCVTGNILPFEQETKAQQLFEQYGAGGFGRGFWRWQADAAWFASHRRDAVKTWMLGAGANASFRSSVFRNPQVGLMDEMLGTGMPCGSGEDLYHFYRTLKAGGTIVYEPKAFLWHKHRRDLPAFKRQLFYYSTGNVAYHLVTLFRDRDCRALPAVLIHLALWHIKRIWHRLTGRSTFPLGLNMIEIAGYLFAPLALWQSYKRVKRLGRSVM